APGTIDRLLRHEAYATTLRARRTDPHRQHGRRACVVFVTPCIAIVTDAVLGSLGWPRGFGTAAVEGEERRDSSTTEHPHPRLPSRLRWIRAGHRRCRSWGLPVATGRREGGRW